MTRYILNSAVITTPGDYSYRIITVERAKEWLDAGTFDSTIGYEETALALYTLTGVYPKINRKQIKMQVNDEALVIRLTCRMRDPTLKGNLTLAFVTKNCEIGLLRKEM